MSLKGFVNQIRSKTTVTQATKATYEAKLSQLRRKLGVDATRIDLDWLADHETVCPIIIAGYKTVESQKGIFFIAKHAAAFAGHVPAAESYGGHVQRLRELTKIRYDSQAANDKEKVLWIEWPEVRAASLTRRAVLHANLAERWDNATAQEYLLLSFYGTMAPRRNEYCTVSLLGDGTETDNRVDWKARQIVIEKHKTVKSMGPCRIAMDDDQVWEVLIQVRDRRQVSPLSDDASLFVTPAGRAYTTQTFGLAIARAFGTILDARISSQMLRKIYLSHYLRGVPPLLDRLETARSMSHSVSMQERYVRR